MVYPFPGFPASNKRMWRSWNWSGAGRRHTEEGPDWSEINRDILELIFLKLPENSLIRSGGVCRKWSSIIHAEQFTENYVNQMTKTRSWVPFTVKGSRYFFQQMAQYDALAPTNSCPVPYVLQPDGESRCLEGAGGLFYFLTGLDETVVHYKINLVQREFRTTPEMRVPKHDPILGLIRTGVDGAHKVVVAGGIGEGSDEDLSVEIYDSQTNSWEIASRLPIASRGCMTSLFVNPAVHDGKFYAYDNYESKCTVLDLENNRWSAPTVVRRPNEMEWKHSYLVESSSGLRLVTIQNAGTRDLSFSAWAVDPQSLEVSDKKTDDSVIHDARPRPPSNFMRFSDRILDVLRGVLGMLLLFFLYTMILSYGLYLRSRSRLKNLLRFFSSLLPCSEPYSAYALKTEGRQRHMLQFRKQ
ncbi:hypothetical protein R1sor_014012 [Riccia sorocarpa]|uniref:F-box domain-containing protein n=1 Tax=Riccia sorocarpa TaxID=122646 RepID=A0ABD3H8C5_9MARC